MYPVLISIFGFKIHTYGVLMAVSFILGLNLAMIYGKKVGIKPNNILDIGLYTLVSVIVGGKLLLLIVDYKYFISNPGEIFFLLFRLGGVYYGGLILAVIIDIWYLKKNNLDIWLVADVLAPYIALGHAVGRLGCFASGCCYGKPTDMPWGVTFTNQYASEMFGVPLYIPIHPTQLYSSLMLLSIFVILIFLRKRKVFDGQVFWSHILLYGCGRYLVENFRGDPRGSLFDGMISTSQLISILMSTLAIGMLIVLYRKHLKKRQE